MIQYLNLLSAVYWAPKRPDRTGVGTTGIFGYQMSFNLGHGFPLLTTKSMFLKGIIHELLWFLSGDTNVRYLQENGVHIWDEWADENGNLGPVYGAQWRSWRGAGDSYDDNDVWNATKIIDQIAKVVRSIKENPYGRRHIVTAWNPIDVDDMALPPCHCLFQFYVHEGRLSCQLYQRSADVFLGVPFNIASYSLLTMMVAQVCGLQPGAFIWTGGDTHLYLNHREQAYEQLCRSPSAPPRMSINPDVRDIFSFTYEDFTLTGYNPQPAIPAPIAV